VQIDGAGLGVDHPLIGFAVGKDLGRIALAQGEEVLPLDISRLAGDGFDLAPLGQLEQQSGQRFHVIGYGTGDDFAQARLREHV